MQSDRNDFSFNKSLRLTGLMLLGCGLVATLLSLIAMF